MSFIKCKKHMISEMTQTDLSVFENANEFDTTNDEQLSLNDAPPHLILSKEEVSHLVPSIKGTDEEVRQKGRILNLGNGRVRELILKMRHTLQQNIQKSNDSSLEYRFICELASEIDPASRHRPYDLSLFQHQRNELSIKNDISATFQPNSEQSNSSEFTCSFSSKSVLFLMNDTDIYEISVPQNLSDKLVASKNIKVYNEDKTSFGNLTLKNDIQIDSTQIYQTILRSLGIDNFDDLPYTVNIYDTSLVDCILSIPDLPSQLAATLVDFLYQKNLLSAYIRSKIAQTLFQHAWANDPSERQKKQWPDLIGRWIALIDPSWVNNAGQLADNLHVMEIFSKFGHLETQALIIIGIAMEIFNGSRRGDSVEFFWSLLFNSIIGTEDAKNVNHRHSALNTICSSLHKKSRESNTRKKTTEILNYLHNLVSSVHFHAVDEIKFLETVVLHYAAHLMPILSNIPFPSSASSPLFYPLALDMFDAKFEGEPTDETTDSGLFSLSEDSDGQLPILEADEDENEIHVLTSSSTRSALESENSYRSRKSRSSRQSRKSAKTKSVVSSASRKSRNPLIPVPPKNKKLNSNNQIKIVNESKPNDTEEEQLPEVDPINDYSSFCSNSKGNGNPLSSHASVSSKKSRNSKTSKQSRNSKASKTSNNDKKIIKKTAPVNNPEPDLSRCSVSSHASKTSRNSKASKKSQNSEASAVESKKIDLQPIPPKDSLPTKFEEEENMFYEEEDNMIYHLDDEEEEIFEQ